jgi:hypothetical protein
MTAFCNRPDFEICCEVSMIYDDGEDCEVTLRDHDGLENDDAENEIYRAVRPKRGGPSV